MTEQTQLNMQTPETSDTLKPLKTLNLMDDFLFDVATVDLENCSNAPDFIRLLSMPHCWKAVRRDLII